MFVELSPSSEVPLSPISAPPPQSWVVAAALVRWQMKRGANDSCVLLSATVSASNAQTISGRSVRYRSQWFQIYEAKRLQTYGHRAELTVLPNKNGVLFNARRS